jgi:4-hydroxybenzoate polyprenyltransferase
VNTRIRFGNTEDWKRQMDKRFFPTYANLLRFPQYVKNGFIFLPLFFSGEITNVGLFLKTSLAFLAFSLAASSIYIFNDMCDMAEDRQHPVKKLRPLSAGEITRKKASLIMVFFLAAGLAVSFFWLPTQVFELMLLYLVLNIFYSLKLKHVSILDIIIISMCFVIRLFVGGVTANIQLTAWIIMMTILLSLFISFAKRRDDVLIRENNGTLRTRKSINGYNLEFINAGMVITASAMIICYIMYAVSPMTASRFGTEKLYITSIFVIAGVLRYLQISFVEQRSGSPVTILFTDIFLQVSIILWLLSFGAFLYLRI